MGFEPIETSNKIITNVHKNSALPNMSIFLNDIEELLMVIKLKTSEDINLQIPVSATDIYSHFHEWSKMDINVKS